jgi:chitinase
MRQAVESENIPAGKSKLLLSIPLPGGSYYGEDYIMSSMIQNLDFANIMAYNLHGPWEPVVYCSANWNDGTPAGSPYHGYSINDAIQYFLNQNGSSLPPEKFNLGVTFAGDEFTLANGDEYSPGSAAIGEGVGGPCTREPGYMAYFEVETLINENAIMTPLFDPVGYCKYFAYDTNQWVGYDDADTLAQKVGLVQKIGLGGISVWAMYAESATGPVLQTAIANALFPNGKPVSADYNSSTIYTPTSTSPESSSSSSLSSSGSSASTAGSTSFSSSSSTLLPITSTILFSLIIFFLL